mmetsp:Transcript_34841/g.96149  ORF Transcript_34841/g.96149 Transcript_34841/m.96149 type:complete len:228 (+) Transcript_34841:258-941(+)
MGGTACGVLGGHGLSHVAPHMAPSEPRDEFVMAPTMPPLPAFREATDAMPLALGPPSVLRCGIEALVPALEPPSGSRENLVALVLAPLVPSGLASSSNSLSTASERRKRVPNCHKEELALAVAVDVTSTMSSRHLATILAASNTCLRALPVERKPQPVFFLRAVGPNAEASATKVPPWRSAFNSLWLRSSPGTSADPSCRRRCGLRRFVATFLAESSWDTPAVATSA